MFPVTHVSASVLLQVLGRLEPLESFSPLLVDGLPEQTVDSETKSSVLGPTAVCQFSQFPGSPSLDHLEYSGFGLESGTGTLLLQETHEVLEENISCDKKGSIFKEQGCVLHC